MTSNLSQYLRQYNAHRQTIIAACEKSRQLESKLKTELDKDEFKNALNVINQIEFDDLEEILKIVHVYWRKHQGNPENGRIIADKLGVNSNDNDVDAILKDLSLDTNKQELKKPCIAVVGQTKAGKSSLVNCLLEKLIVSQAQTRTTARMTHLHHSSRKYVAEKKINEDTLKAFHLREEEKIPEEYLGAQLSGGQRSNPDIIGIEIHAGLESSLLKSGLKIVDSPGLNENKELNNLLKTLMASQLPLVIYVISGHKCLTEEDIKDIREMKDHNAELQIIYFVTKLDMTKANKRDNPEKDPIEEAENRLQRVFEGLQKSGLLSTEATREECPEFHGASLINMMPTPRRPFTLSDDDDDSNRFRRFQKCLFEKAQMYLYHNAMKAANDLSLLLQQTLHVILNHASELDRNHTKIKDMQKSEVKEFRKTEQKIYEKLKSGLKETNQSIRLDFIEMLQRQEARAEDIMKEFKYSADLEEQLTRSSRSKENIENCKKEINQALAVALDSEISYFIEHNILPGENSNENILKELMNPNNMIGQTSLFKLLESRLINNYKLHEYDQKKNRNKLKQMKKTMKKKFSSFKNLFHDTKFIEINPKSFEWIKEQALDFQRHFDAETFTEEYFKSLNDDLEKSHDKFIKQLDYQNASIEKELQLTTDEKEALRDYPAQFAGLYARCLDIIGDYEYPDSAIQQLDTLGRGGQGVVHKCRVNQELMARKTCRFNNFETAALEIYYFSRFSHPNLQNLRGIRLNLQQKKLIQFLDLARCDGKDYLISDAPPLKKRVELAIQICEGIKCIHTQGIMHRDLKLENVLIDANDNAIVTDFGYCKPEAFATTLAGTPIHMAPEVITQDVPYKKSADIYSFGILLWYLIDGTGDHPQYIREDQIETPFQALDATKLGKRPEIKDEFPTVLGELMTKCWDKEPEQRPGIDDIIETLENFRQTLP